MWLAFFSLVAFALLATPFCSILFAHGRFSHADAIATATAVCAYGIGIVFNSASKVVQQGFFAIGRTRQVVINSLIYLTVNAICSWYFSQFDDGPVPFGLSNSLAAACDFTLNVFFLRKLCGQKGIAFFEHAGPSGFSPKRALILSLLAFPIAGGGILWALRVTDIAHTLAPNVGLFWTNLTLLTIGGSCFLGLFVVATRLWGPTALQATLSRAVGKVKKRFRLS
jgi:peptidoglycan biosynthesis protein MviN/MurJ (putative lipid II flippase)